MNELFYIKYRSELMLCDTMDMTAFTELAHRRLSDFIWRQSKAYRFNVPLLIHFTKCPAEAWDETWAGLQEKGWRVAGDYVIHQGVIETHNAAQMEYAAECNQTAPATAKKTGKAIALSKVVTDDVTGIATIVVTSVVTKSATKDVTRTQSESKSESESESELSKTSVPSQSSQSTPKPAGLNLTMLTFPMLERVCREIINNTHSWHYDNHKLRPDELAQGGLIGALRPFVGRLTEKQAHETWQEAATRTHKAVVDEMAIADRAKYAVACWKDQMTNVADKVNGKASGDGR